MLRVSSLGLLHYHDTERHLLLCLKRSFSEAARKIPQVGGTRPARQHKHFSANNDSGDTSPLYSEKPLSPASGPVGGRRRVVILPLQTSKKYLAPSRKSALQAEMATGSEPRFISRPDQSSSDFQRGSLDPSGSDIQPSQISTAYELPPEKPDLKTQDREYYEDILDTTYSATEAWEAYERLLTFPRTAPVRLIYYARLHRLARLLSSTRPRTRTLFLRFISVLTTLHDVGGTIHQWEWNALVDMAGKGWRKTRLEDFQAALDFYRNMVVQRPPGAQLHRSQIVVSSNRPVNSRSNAKPDIVTYTTLMNIAGRTLDHASLRHAESLLVASGLPRNRITNLVLIRYFTRKGDLMGVRTTLLRMKEQDHELGRDGVNACIWAYARNGRIDVAELMYRISKHRLLPKEERDPELDVCVRQLAATEGLHIPADFEPDATTYNALIQSYAYHGDLVKSLNVFMDMLTMEDRSPFLSMRRPPGDPSRTDNSPTLPAFRAIFLGFARHGRVSQYDVGPVTNRLTSSSSEWNMLNLEALFTTFIKSAHGSQPSDRTIYWVLMAFDRLSNHSKEKLRKVWEKLEERFGGGWRGRLARLRKRIHEDRQDE